MSRQIFVSQFLSWHNTLVYPVFTHALRSHVTHYVSATKTNRLMLFGETVAVYCENHTKHTNTLCGQNAQF
jgi:hypothetical protein